VHTGGIAIIESQVGQHGREDFLIYLGGGVVV
jgi:hypothetical protein